MEKLMTIVEVEGNSFIARVRGEEGFPVQGRIYQMWEQAKHLLGDDQTFRYSEFGLHGDLYTATWDGVGYRVIFKSGNTAHTHVDVEIDPNNLRYGEFRLIYTDNRGDDMSDEEEVLFDRFIDQIDKLQRMYGDNTPPVIEQLPSDNPAHHRANVTFKQDFF